MNIFFISVLVGLLCFHFGKSVGRIQTELLFPSRLLALLSAIKKVESLCALSGKSLKELSDKELVDKINEQLVLHNNKEE